MYQMSVTFNLSSLWKYSKFHTLEIMSRADTVFLLHFADVCIDMYVEEEWAVVSKTFNKLKSFCKLPFMSNVVQQVGFDGQEECGRDLFCNGSPFSGYSWANSVALCPVFTGFTRHCSNSQTNWSPRVHGRMEESKQRSNTSPLRPSANLTYTQTNMQSHTHTAFYLLLKDVSVTHMIFQDSPTHS